jgi:hypothetical protein
MGLHAIVIATDARQPLDLLPTLASLREEGAIPHGCTKGTKSVLPRHRREVARRQHPTPVEPGQFSCRCLALADRPQVNVQQSPRLP